MMQKSGDRRLTNRHFLRRQYGLELSQRDIRLLCHQLPDQVLVRRQSIPLVPAEFGRTDTARFAVEPTKADHRADTHTEALRNFRYRGALLRRPHHARTQILRIRLPHPILASFPARILNPIRVRMGIPPDSVFSGNALSAALTNANSSVWLISMARVTFFSLSFNRGGNDRKSLSIHGVIPCSGATEIVGS